MSERLARRGPDDDGTWSRGPVALGHRRLAIIDLADRAAQPMVDPDTGNVLVFNGCVYNHRDLRRELTSAGHRFRSTSDTEVVLAAHREWGDDAVDHLVGMFAYGLHEPRTGRTVLVRDRLGIKPLYLADRPGRLRFASTLPALLAGGDVDTSIDPVGLHHYLTFHSTVPGPHTILAGVRKLPPATVLIVEADGRRRERRYWSARYGRHPARADWTDRDWQDAIADALRTAVRRRLEADVPVGILLSGGLDSSLIAALVAEEGGSRPRTYSIGFDGAGGRAGDEYRWSDLVAREVDADHHRIHIGADRLVDALPGTVAAMGEPMASHDVAAFWLLSREVARDVNVVQSGQGADEVFAGYRWLAELGDAPGEGAADAYLDAFRDRGHEETVAMVAHPDRVAPDDVSAALVHDHVGSEPGLALDRALRLEVEVVLPDDPLKRVDNMTMDASLEARVPFLDADLVELAAQCPAPLKAGDGGKAVLKEIGRKLLPTEVVDRPKGYFPVPALVELEGPIRRQVETVLRSPEARRRGLFRPELLEQLAAEPNRHRTPTGGNVAWHVAVLEWWLQLQVDPVG